MNADRHITDDDVTLLYYGELTGADERDTREHLRACAGCRTRHDELLRLFALVDGCPVPEPEAGYEAQVWQRLQPALRAAGETRRAGFAERLRAWVVPAAGARWALAGGVVVLVIGSFVAGRYWQTRPGPAPAVETAQARAGIDDLRARILLSALGDHFDRTRVMLVSLTSTEPAAAIDISAEQRRAVDLLAATRIYRRAAVEAGDPAVADVLDALERVLTEITMSPTRLTAFELEALQKRIETQELLFKLRVASSAVRDRESAGNRPAGRTSAGV